MFQSGIIPNAFLNPQVPTVNYVASSTDSASIQFLPSLMYYSFSSVTVISAAARQLLAS